MTNEVYLPLGDRVLVLPFDMETKTAGGLLLPPTAQEKQQRGKVIAVGDECKKVKVGDTVLFGKHTGTDLEEYKLFNEPILLAIIEKA